MSHRQPRRFQPRPSSAYQARRPAHYQARYARAMEAERYSAEGRYDQGGRSPAVATFLSLLWPGLGQAYGRRPRRAARLAVPPLLVALALLVAVIALGPAVFLAYLLHPLFAAAAGLLLVGLAGWWAMAVIDAGRPRTWGSVVTTLVVLAVLAVGTGWVGSVVWSLYQAGARISQPADGPLAVAPSGPPSSPQGPVMGTPHPSASQAPIVQLGDRVTILFVGADRSGAGEGRLTDTIQVASFDRLTGRIVVISIPRDTAQLPLYNGGTWNGRINALAAHAERNPERFPDGGLGTLARQVEFIIGVPVDFYAAVDFRGFERLIDMVGGVDVVVERPIDDPSYQISPTVRGFRLAAGEHHLDGPTALIYVRSRHGPGNSDFQRARRQQQVLLALRQKVDDPGVLANLPSIIDAASAMVRTNVPLDRVPEIVGLLQQSTGAATERYVLQPRTYAQVIPRTETGGAYMIRLKMDAVAELSIKLFGQDSRYAP